MENNNISLTSNRGFNVGDVITEVRSHPYIKDGQWAFNQVTVHFEITEVLKREYICRYIDGFGGNWDSTTKEPFYWSFWDKQPNNGFMKNGSSSVRYCVPIENLKERNRQYVTENSGEFDKTKFYHNPGSESVTMVYYNPDSTAGGQLVYSDISFDLIRESVNVPHEDFYTHLEGLANGTLIDVDSKEFYSAAKNFAEKSCTYEIECISTQKKMLKLAGLEYALMFGHLGNGITVFNRLEEVNGDLKTLAHIDPDRVIKFREKNLPEEVRAEIENFARTDDSNISATQNRKVFRTRPTPPRPTRKPGKSGGTKKPPGNRGAR